jgi:uncharacterized protein (TIGR02391 family)
MTEIRSIIPDSETLLALEVEELAGVLLLHLNSRGDGGAELHHYNFFNDLRNIPPYGKRDDRINRALMEAWDWLLYEGFLAKRGDDGTGAGTFVTRRGQRLKSRDDFDAYRKANLLPKGQLHPLIASEVYPAFLRGKYDTAIFEAFREVEVAVRAAGNFGATDLGTDLMRAAFKPEKRGQVTAPGPLTDTQLPIAEQEAMANLFAGAIGLYKNPQSHRHVPTEADDTAEVIVFASQLLRIVDRLKPQPSEDVPPSP